MSMTDPISDMLTRIRNANMNMSKSVDIPSSKVKLEILRILKNEGFIDEYKEISVDGNKTLVRVYLKYGPLKQRVINRIDRVSRPGRRIYKKAAEVEDILGGIGTAIYSTSRGIISDKECRRLNVGGEILCIVS